MKRALEEVRNLITRLTDPARMSPEEYYNFLEEMIADLSAMQDALSEENPELFDS